MYSITFAEDYVVMKFKITLDVSSYQAMGVP